MGGWSLAMEHLLEVGVRSSSAPSLCKVWVEPGQLDDPAPLAAEVLGSEAAGSQSRAGSPSGRAMLVWFTTVCSGPGTSQQVLMERMNDGRE